MPEKFPIPTGDFEERDNIKSEIKELLEAKEGFSKFLKEEAEVLREKGFSPDMLGNDCRLQISGFRDLYGRRVEKDQDYVSRKKKWIEEGGKIDEKELRDQLVGEVVEIGKTVLFNRYWFTESAFTVRTSKYDDFSNGVDELIFAFDEKEERFVPIAAADTASDLSQKRSGAKRELIRQTRTHGARVTYGIAVSGDVSNYKVEKTQYDDLPFFIVPLSIKSILEIGKTITSGKMGSTTESKINSIKGSLFDELIIQSKENLKYEETTDKLRGHYAKIAPLLESLKTRD